MKCPVCNTECGDSVMCPTCGFDQLDVEFLNREDADEWVKQVVMTYRTHYCKMFNLCNSEFQIKNGVLVKYTGKGKSVNIPFGVSEIGERAFHDCDSIVSVYIPACVIRIMDYAFCGCVSLQSISFPKSLKLIGVGAFMWCDSLTTVYFQNPVPYFYPAVFSDCPKLADTNGFVIVCGVLYDYFGNNTSIRIPDSVTEIDISANFDSLTSIILSNNISRIDNEPFRYCNNLLIMMIPKSVKRIDDGAFEGCDNMTILTPAGSYAEQYAKDNFIPFKNIEI